MKLLDLFCGGGGASMGYFRAGFTEIIGLDINKQPSYPFTLIKGDALEYLKIHGNEFDAIHASPPCQLYTRKNANWGRARNHWDTHPDLVDPTRSLLQTFNKPWVIENVPGAPIRHDLMLCGTMFGLRIRKHRFFEANFPITQPTGQCDHKDVYNPWSGQGRTAEKMREALGIDWLPMAGGASRKAGYTGDLYNAIPPAYTEYIGKFMMELFNDIR